MAAILLLPARLLALWPLVVVVVVVVVHRLFRRVQVALAAVARVAPLPERPRVQVVQRGRGLVEELVLPQTWMQPFKPQVVEVARVAQGKMLPIALAATEGLVFRPALQVAPCFMPVAAAVAKGLQEQQVLAALVAVVLAGRKQTALEG